MQDKNKLNYWLISVEIATERASSADNIAKQIVNGFRSGTNGFIVQDLVGPSCERAYRPLPSVGRAIKAHVRKVALVVLAGDVNKKSMDWMNALPTTASIKMRTFEVEAGFQPKI